MKNFNFDEKQLEFLGKFFTTAAGNAKQYNSFASLFDLKKSDDNDLLSLFKNFYNLPNAEAESEKKSDAFSDAFENFQKLMRQYTGMFNFSDNSKLKELEEKCEKLTKELEEKDREIKVLKSVIEQSDNQADLINNFQKIFEGQGKEFKTIMDKFDFFPNSK